MPTSVLEQTLKSSHSKADLNFNETTLELSPKQAYHKGMPELAAFYSVGVLCSFIATLFFAITEMNFYRRQDYLVLQSNLNQVGQRWSQLSGRVELLSESITDEEERQKVQTTFLLFGFVAVILSWVGFIFLVLIWVSVKKFLNNRLEEALFSSELASQKLELAQIELEWSKIQSEGVD